MATIITRAGKGSPLTNNELDANFTNLNTELGTKLTAADLAPYLTSSSAAATYLPLAGGTLTGDLTFSGANRRIIGDFTSTSRLLVQTNSANSNTVFGLIPNGTAVNSQFHVWGASDITNAPLGAFTINASAVQIQSAAAGTGTVLPFRVLVGSTEVFRAATSANVLIGTTTDDGSNKLQLAGSAAVSGNLNFTGSSNRITGDFSNATPSSRAAFQSSTANGNTLVNLIPNGTATVSRWGAFNNSNTANASVVSIGITSTAAEIVSTFNGTGTALPLDFYTNGAKQLSIDTAGVATFTQNPILSAGTANQVQFLNGSKVLTGSANLTFNGTTLSVADLTDASLTANRVVFAGTGGNLQTNSNLFFDGTNLGVGTTSTFGNSTVGAVLGFVARNSGVTQGYFQTFNSNAGADLKTWRFGGDNSGNFIFQTVNDAYSSATGRMTLDASGNLVLGATAANYSLDIRKANSSVRVGHDTNGFGVGLSWDNPTGEARVWSLGAYPLVLGSNGTERARIDSSGNFMIGQSFASGMFTVNDTAASGTYSQAGTFRKSSTNTSLYYQGARVVIQNTSATVGNFSSLGFQTANGNDYAAVWGIATSHTASFGAGHLAFGTSNNDGVAVERARITNSGNLLVGTSTDIGCRAMFTASATAGNQALIGFEGADAQKSAVFLSGYFNGTGCPTIFSSYNGTGSYLPLAFHLGGSERMRIDSSGRLLVNTTFAIGAAARVQAIGSVNNDAFWGEVPSGSTGGGTCYIGKVQNTQAYLAYWLFGSTPVGNINTNGTTTSYNTTSDYRLKEFVAEVTGSGERLDALRPVEFDWKVNGQRSRGFFAHEFQAVYSQSVSGEKDAVDANGDPVYQAMQAGSSEVIADLVAEIKSLRRRVAALESN